MIDKGIIDRLKKIIPVGDELAAPADFADATNCRQALITLMYHKRTQERLDEVADERRRMLRLLQHNLTDIMNFVRERENMMIRGILASQSYEAILDDLERIWIHDAPLMYQRIRNELNLDTFRDLLSVGSLYQEDASKYYVSQGGKRLLRPLSESVQSATIQYLLSCSVRMGMLSPKLDGLDFGDMDLDGSDEERSYDNDMHSAVGDFVANYDSLHDTKATRNVCFFSQQYFVEKSTDEKITHLLQILKDNDEIIYRILLSNRKHFFHFIGQIDMPAYLATNTLTHYTLLDRVSGVKRDELSIWRTNNQPAQTITSANVMQYAYLSFLALITQHCLYEDLPHRQGMSIALEKFKQFAQSTHVALVSKI